VIALKITDPCSLQKGHPERGRNCENKDKKTNNLVMDPKGGTTKRQTDRPAVGRNINDDDDLSMRNRAASVRVSYSISIDLL
jgi:hypothetical protein